MKPFKLIHEMTFNLKGQIESFQMCLQTHRSYNDNASGEHTNKSSHRIIKGITVDYNITSHACIY